MSSVSTYTINKTFFRSIFRGFSDSSPIGIPLYKYRCDERKYQQIKSFLELNSDEITHRHAAPPYIHEIFCFYVAEWVRRNHTSGHIRWADIRTSLNWTLATDSTLSYLAREGIPTWNREVLEKGGSPAYLHTLQVEGGLPLKMIENHQGALSKYFRKIVDSIKSTVGELNCTELAECYADLLPNSLKVDVVFELAGSLAKELVNLINECGAYSGNIVNKLDTHIPKWHERLPVSLDKDGADNLVKNIFSVESLPRRSFPSTFAIERKWFDEEGGWFCEAKYKLPIKIKAEHLARLFNMPRELKANRLVLKSTIEDSEDDIALFSLDQNTEEWMIEAFPEAKKTIKGKKAQAHAEFKLFDGLEKVGDCIPKGGYELPDDLPWVMESIDEHASALKMIGVGSVSTRAETLYIALPKGSSMSLSMSNDFEIPRFISDSDRVLIATTGEYEVVLASGHKCIIRTGIEEVGDVHYTFGRNVFKSATSDLPIYHALPLLLVNTEDAQSIVPNEQLFWRAMKPGNTIWHCCSEKEAMGKVEIRHLLNGEVQHSSKCVVLPKDFTIRAEPIGTHEGIVAFEQFSSSMRPELINFTDNLKAKSIGDQKLHFTSTDVTPQPIALKLVWEDLAYVPVKLTIDFPAYGCFIVHHGEVLAPEASLPVSELYDIQAKGIKQDGNNSKFWLRMLANPEESNQITSSMNLLWLLADEKVNTKELDLAPLIWQVKSALYNSEALQPVTLEAFTGDKFSKLNVYKDELQLSRQGEVLSILRFPSNMDGVWFRAVDIADSDHNQVLLELNKANTLDLKKLDNQGEWLITALRGDQVISNTIRLLFQDEVCTWNKTKIARTISTLSEVDETQVVKWKVIYDLFNDYKDFDLAVFDIFQEITNKPDLLIDMLLYSVAHGQFDNVIDLEKAFSFNWGTLGLNAWQEAAHRYTAFLGLLSIPNEMKLASVSMLLQKLDGLSKIEPRCLIGIQYFNQIVNSALGKTISQVKVTHSEFKAAVQQLLRLYSSVSKVKSVDFKLYLNAIQDLTSKAVSKKVKELFPLNKYEHKCESVIQHVLIFAALSLSNTEKYVSYKNFLPMFEMFYQQAPQQLGIIYAYYQQELSK